MKDCILHVPSGIMLDFAEPDFGNPAAPEIIDQWRRAGHHAKKGEFKCWRHRDHEHPWLCLREKDGVLIAAHWPGSGLHDQFHHGMSDEHKRQTEYITRAAEDSGYRTELEYSLPTGVRLDAAIFGPSVTGVEVQRSAATRRTVVTRTTKAQRAGVTSLWFKDGEGQPPWFFRVPSVGMSLGSWASLPDRGSVAVASGVRVIEAQRCRDILHGICSNRFKGCNKFHPVHGPRMGLVVDDIAALVPAGKLVPMRWQYHSTGRADAILLVAPADKAHYEELTGHAAGLALRPGPRRQQDRERIECSADAGTLLAPSAFTGWKWCPSCPWPVPVGGDQVVGVCRAHRVPYRAVEWDPPRLRLLGQKHAAHGLCQPLLAYLAAQAQGTVL